MRQRLLLGLGVSGLNFHGFDWPVVAVSFWIEFSGFFDHLALLDGPCADVGHKAIIRFFPIWHMSAGLGYFDFFDIGMGIGPERLGSWLVTRLIGIRNRRVPELIFHSGHG